MVKRTTWKKIPDAWEDDDWETQADRAATAEPEEPEIPLSKKERQARHAETNRQIWESAESSQLSYHLATASPPPLAQPFKAPKTVLARKPQLAKRDPVTGIASLTLDDSDDETDRKPQETPEEIRARQQREREEKQRRYDEVRAKIFADSGSGSGSGGKRKSNPSSGGSTPGTVTPPRTGAGARRGRGSGRGGGFRGHDRGAKGGSAGSENQQPGNQSGRRDIREKELFDPNYSPKPGFMLEKKGPNVGASLSGRSATPREEDQIIRMPRGPDGGGRGGFGFARRNAKEG